jgi:secondary thiamine-phosphate synthase enzyme
VAQENACPEAQLELANCFYRLVPPLTVPSMYYLAHSYQVDDRPAHMKGAMVLVKLSIPVSNGQLNLGTCQRIYLFEHRTAPKIRQVVGSIASNGAYRTNATKRLWREIPMR